MKEVKKKVSKANNEDKMRAALRDMVPELHRLLRDVGGDEATTTRLLFGLLAKKYKKAICLEN